MAQVDFIQISRTSFTSLVAGTLSGHTLDPAALYFVFDNPGDTVGDLYRGSVKMSYPAMVVADRPLTPLKNTIYVNTTSGVSEIYDGTNWIGVGPKIVTSTTTSAEGYAWTGDSADDAAVPTVKAVGQFVSKAISDVTGGSGVVTAVTKNATDGKQLDVVTNGVTNGIILDGLVTDFTYNSTTGALVLTKTVNGVATPMTAVNLPLEQALTGVEQHRMSESDSSESWYDADAIGQMGLLLTVTNLSNNSTVEYWVSLESFIVPHDTVSGTTGSDIVGITVSESNIDGTLTWTITTSFNPANITDDAIAQSKINGLTTALSDKMELIAGATADNLLAVNAAGQAVDSGIAKANVVTKVAGTANTIFVNDGTGALRATSTLIGNDSTAAASFGTANTVATEIAAKTYADSLLEWTVIS